MRRKSWWREVIMLFGISGMVICGYLVGKDYFNQIMTEIHRGAKDAE